MTYLIDDVARTWAVGGGSPGVVGDVITFANEIGYVRNLAYWTIGRTYKINVTIASYSGAGNIILPYDSSVETDIYGASIVKAANGTYEYYYIPTVTTVQIYSYAGHTAVVTTNSIQETDNRGMGSIGMDPTLQ